MKLLKCLLALTAFVSCHAVCVEIDQDEYRIRLSGKIESGDLRKIVSAVTGPKGFPKYIHLNSPGGDILEAMKIGNFTRDTLTQVYVGGTCASACVFILVGGVYQTSSDTARIGLHRPYFPKEYFSGLSLQAAEEKYKDLQAAAKRYLFDMETPTWLVERMFAVPSDDMYFLSLAEKKQLRESPSAYAEWIRAKCSPPTPDEHKRFNIFDAIDTPPRSDSRPSFGSTSGNMMLPALAKTSSVATLAPAQ